MLRGIFKYYSRIITHNMADTSKNYRQSSFFNIESTRERLETLNVLLVKPKIGWTGPTAYLLNPLDVIDPNYQIYAPGMFILGPLKEEEEGKFSFSPVISFDLARLRGTLTLVDIRTLDSRIDTLIDHGLMPYRDSYEDLQQFQSDIDNGNLEVVRGGRLSGSDLEHIATIAKTCADARR